MSVWNVRSTHWCKRGDMLSLYSTSHKKSVLAPATANNSQPTTAEANHINNTKCSLGVWITLITDCSIDYVFTIYGAFVVQYITHTHTQYFPYPTLHLCLTRNVSLEEKDKDIWYVTIYMHCHLNTYYIIEVKFQTPFFISHSKNHL